MTSLSAFGLSDIGVSRQNNEDIWIACPEIGFFALADGMGGHKAGEVAAKETVEHLSHTIKNTTLADPLEWMIELGHAIEKTNQWVYRLGQKDDALQGMGTTLCCLIWTKEAVIYAHVGDSRIYRLRDQKLELLTQDHSLFTKWLKTGKKSSAPYPYKNVITRAIGTSPTVTPEIAISTHLPGDLFLLCTDGLSDVLPLEEIEKMINRSPTLEIASKRLIQKAKIKGSSDNITILMIQSGTQDAKDLLRQQRDDPSRPESAPGHAPGLEGTSSESL